MADEVIIQETTTQETTPIIETKEKGKPDLKGIIKDAVESFTPKEEIKEEPKVAPKIEAPKEEEDLNAEQLNFAKTLYKALNNPDPQVQLKTLRILANAANLDLKEIKTEKQVESAEETLSSLLKAGLGEFDFLADKLGPVLEKALEKYVEKHTKDIKETQRLDKEERIKSEINIAVQSAFDEFENSTEVKEDVLKLMDQFRPTGKTSHKEYFRSLIILAASQKGINLKSIHAKQDTEKVNRNRTDAMSRLASERGAEVKEVVRTTGFKNLKAAVQDAAEKAAEMLASKSK